MVPEDPAVPPLHHLAPVEGQLVHGAHLEGGELLLPVELGQDGAEGVDPGLQVRRHLLLKRPVTRQELPVSLGEPAHSVVNNTGNKQPRSDLRAHPEEALNEGSSFLINESP